MNFLNIKASKIFLHVKNTQKMHNIFTMEEVKFISSYINAKIILRGDIALNLT